MGPFGMGWTGFVIYLLGSLGMLLLGRAVCGSKKWKEKAEYYFHWNDELSGLNK